MSIQSLFSLSLNRIAEYLMTPTQLLPNLIDTVWIKNNEINGPIS